MTKIVVRRAGDRGALLDVPEGAAARVAHELAAVGDFVDVVPGHRTVLVTWESDAPPDDELAAVALRAIDRQERAVAPQALEIPVTYDGEDLEAVAALVGLSVLELVRAHTAPEYTVAFLGFQPGFAYLLGGDE